MLSHINLWSMTNQPEAPELSVYTPEGFLDAVEKAIVAREMTATAFGRAATGDPTFVFELRNGRSCGLKVVNQVLDFIRSAGDDNGRGIPKEGCAA